MSWACVLVLSLYVCCLFTPPKTNMDTQNDGVEEVTPFKNDNYWYLC